MNPESRKTFLQLALVLAVVLACLVFRKVFYFFEIMALELRYFWWLLLIVGGGIWLLATVGRKSK